MQTVKQYSFFKSSTTQFGGSLLVGKRKDRRPLSTRRPLHVVLKSANAKGAASFVNHKLLLEKMIAGLSKKNQVKLYDLVVNFDHIHIVIWFRRVSQYQAWIRSLNSKIVRLLSKKLGKNLKGFFSLRPFTRILNWGKDFKNALAYLILNKMELVGLRPPKNESTEKPSKSKTLRARSLLV